MANYDVTTAAASLEFDANASTSNNLLQVDTNHFLDVWHETVSADIFAQVLAVNTSTWAVTTAASSLTIETQNTDADALAAIQVDVNHYMVVWLGGAATADTRAQILAVNTTTFAVSTAASAKLIDTDVGSDFALAAVDTNHFMLVWKSAAGDGFSQVLAVNTTTWAITTAGAQFEFDTRNLNSSSVVLVDSTHVLVSWFGGATGVTGLSQVLAFETTTWGVSTAAAALTFDASATATQRSAMIQMDTNHFYLMWAGASGDGFSVVLAVNTSTFAVTTAAAAIEFDTQDCFYGKVVAIDSGHVIQFWGGPGSDGFTQVLTVNTSTWGITTAAASLEFDTQNGFWNSAAKIDSSHYLNTWAGGASSTGFAQVFAVEIPATANDGNLLFFF